MVHISRSLAQEKIQNFIVNNIIKVAKNFLQNHNITDEFICIVPGAAWEQKQLPVNKYDQLIEDLGYDDPNIDWDQPLVG